MVVAPAPVPELVISPVGLTSGAETVNTFALFALKVTLPAFKTLPLTVRAPVPLFVKERLPVFVYVPLIEAAAPVSVKLPDKLPAKWPVLVAAIFVAVRMDGDPLVLVMVAGPVSVKVPSTV